MTRVLPLPAPARTSTGPFVVVTASRCGGFSGARRLSAVTAGCGMGSNDNTGKRTTRGRAATGAALLYPLGSPSAAPRQATAPDARLGADFTSVLSGRLRYSTVTDLA